MPSFGLQVEVAELPDVLTAMREWLDHHGINIEHFRSISERQGMVTINVRFDLDDHAELFRQQFGAKALASP